MNKNNCIGCSEVVVPCVQHLLSVSVSALPEAGRKQAARDAAEAEALQEQNDSGLQNVGRWDHQHGSGRHYML
jgi:hypothetical protein